MPKAAAKRTPPQNRARTTAPATDQRWFEVTNLAEPGYAEIRLRGYIGAPRRYVNEWSGIEVSDPEAAGTLQEFEAELEALGNVSNLQVTISSEGGEVWCGMAIHNLLMRHPAHKVCVIDGICASAATYPAMACHEIRIPANAWMMIHGSTGGCYGTARDMREYAEMLESINASAVSLYSTRTGLENAAIIEMMETTTWMNGDRAVELRFADTVLEPMQNLAARAGTIQPTNLACLRNAPVDALALFDMSRTPTPANSAIHPMFKLRTPLMNAAEKGGSAGTPPAATPPNPAPATAPASTPAVEAGAQQPPANNVPPTVVPPMQQQQQQQAPDIATIVGAAVTTAVNTAIAPVQERLSTLEGQHKAGITPANLGGAQPAPIQTPPAAEKKFPEHPLNKVSAAWAPAKPLK